MRVKHEIYNAYDPDDDALGGGGSCVDVEEHVLTIKKRKNGNTHKSIHTDTDTDERTLTIMTLCIQHNHENDTQTPQHRRMVGGV